MIIPDPATVCPFAAASCPHLGNSRPNHHLWDNHGIWFIAYTIHPEPHKKERRRESLQTRCLETARYRRDLVLARRWHEGVLALPRTWQKSAR